MLDLLLEIRQTLRNNRLRTVLTGIAVAWGIFMLIILLGAARGLTNYFKESTANDVNNLISLWPGVTSQPHKGYKDGRLITLKQGDGQALMSELSGTVADVIPFASNDTATISTSRDVCSGGFNAVFPPAGISNGVKMLHGRFVNNLDVENCRRVMVICDRDARLLFGSEAEALGKTVKCMNLAWTVVGIFNHRWRTQAYVPYTTFKKLTGNNDIVEQLDVYVDGLTTLAEGEAAENAIRATLANRHSFSPEDRSAVWSWNKFNDYLTTRNMSIYLEMAVWVIGILTLLTGIVGVSNIMFVSVRERTHEIGIRRAIGAKPRSILMQVLTESIALTALFGYIGVFFGMTILQVINHFTQGMDGFTNPTVDISIAVKVTVALIVAGAFAGLFPALKATKVKPVEALRDE